MESGDAIVPICIDSLQSQSISNPSTVIHFQSQFEESNLDLSLSEHHGRNIQLSDRRFSAKRIASYNQAVVMSHKPLVKGHVFQVN